MYIYVLSKLQIYYSSYKKDEDGDDEVQDC